MPSNCDSHNGHRDVGMHATTSSRRTRIGRSTMIKWPTNTNHVTNWIKLRCRPLRSTAPSNRDTLGSEAAITSATRTPFNCPVRHIARDKQRTERPHLWSSAVTGVTTSIRAGKGEQSAAPANALMFPHNSARKQKVIHHSFFIALLMLLLVCCGISASPHESISCTRHR